MEVETCYPPLPKVVQISASHNSNAPLYALSSDGRIWVYNNLDGKWWKLPPVPVDEKAAPAIVPPERLLDR